MKTNVLLFVGAALLLGCRKDDALVICPPDNQAAFNTYKDFIRRNGASEQVFAFALNQNQTLQTRAGAVVQFRANAFVLPSGLPATGQAELRVRELYTAPDFLLADMPTGDASATYLESGGQFKLQAWQGTTRLRMRPADTLRLASPAPDSTFRAGMTTWALQLPAARWVNTQLAVANGIASNQAFYRSQLPLDTLSWWNVDRMWAVGTAQAGTTAAGFSFDTDAASTTFTRTWVLPVGTNAVFPTFMTGNSLLLPGVPVGSQLKAVVLQFRVDGLYFGTQTAATQLNVTPHVALTRLSEAEILQRMRLL